MNRLTFLVVLLPVVLAQPLVAQAPFSISDWKDCEAQICNAGEAFRYLLASRQSDNNNCKAALELEKKASLRDACDVLVPLSEAPIDDTGLVAAFMQVLNSQSNTFPLPWASSIGGFSFTVDPGGAPIFETNSFGPLFAERPLTGGQGSWSVSIGYQRETWTGIDSLSFDRISAEKTRPLTDTRVCQPNDCLSLRWTSEISFRTSHVLLSSSWGLSDRFDLGVNVPITTVMVEGRSFRSGKFSALKPDGEIEGTVQSADGHSTGFGDVSVRGKLRLGANSRKLQWAAASEVRFPTGDPLALTGTGHSAIKAALLMAYAVNPISERAVERLGFNLNVGYTWAGGGIDIDNEGSIQARTGGASTVGVEQHTADFSLAPANELNVVASMDLSVSRRLTIIGEYMLRGLLDGSEVRTNTFPGLLDTQISQPFVYEKAFQPIQYLAAGVKWLVGRNWVGSIHVLVPTTDYGLRSRLAPIVRLERRLR